MLTETHRYMEYDIPVDLINLTGGGPDTFALISEQHIHHIQQYVGIKSTDNVVEVGCGIGRDAIPLTMLLGKGGQYLGIDIIARSINWCSANISKRHPNFRFVHFDVADQLHNPSGTLPISACHLPLPPGSVDLIILQSVFTHMFADGMTSYMTEFARVLKSTGRVYATCFVVDDALLSKLRDKPVTQWKIDFRHRHGEGCYINDPDSPTGAVAYSLPKLAQIVDSSRLKFSRPLIRGAWSETVPDADCGQDVMILEISGAPHVTRA